MTRRTARCYAGWAVGFAYVLFQAFSIPASNYVVRQVTDFGSPTFGSSATPLGVANDRLVFLARENGLTGLYSTDGSNVALINNSITISATDVAQLSNGLYFPATGVNGKELYMTDGYALRQVADLAPGTLSSSPNDFIVLNDRLLFSGITDSPSPNGVPVRFFHTDGTTTEEFSSSLFSPVGSVRLGGRLIYGGLVPGSLGPITIQVTDGESSSTVATPHVVGPPVMTKVGSYAYFIAGNNAERGIYRTDGTAGELVLLLDAFTPLNDIVHMFENAGSLVFTINDTARRELVFFRTEGTTPTEILRWPIPTGVFLTSSILDAQPTYSDDSRAYFSLQHGASRELYKFDGASFSFLASGDGFTEFNFAQLGSRVFLNVNHPVLEDLQLSELIDGSFVPIGVGLDQLISFQGDVFGWNWNIPTKGLRPKTLLQIQDGALGTAKK